MLKKRIRFGFLSFFAMVFLFLGLGISQSYASSTGWAARNGHWYYYQNNTMAKGWLHLGSTWYFLDQSGVMKTGWVYVNNKWYFMDASGAMKTNWVYDHGKWYFMDASGAMVTNWLHEQGKTYYLQPDGSMKTGWMKILGKTYFFQANGALVTGKFSIDGKLYYFNQDGSLYTDGWLTLGTQKFYANPSTGQLQPNGVWVSSNAKLTGKTIVLDPGHGGTDTGAIGGGVYEKNINLREALKFADILRSNGATVYLTRTTDVFVTLDGRVQFSNSIKPDAFISIHVNSEPGNTAQGIETYYNSVAGVMPVQSKQLATDLQTGLIKSTGAVNRSVRDDNLHVTRGNQTPAVLVEIGFITSDSERSKLISDTYETEIANGLLNGVINFFNSK